MLNFLHVLHSAHSTSSEVKLGIQIALSMVQCRNEFASCSWTAQKCIEINDIRTVFCFNWILILKICWHSCDVYSSRCLELLDRQILCSSIVHLKSDSETDKRGQFSCSMKYIKPYTIFVGGTRVVWIYPHNLNPPSKIHPKYTNIKELTPGVNLPFFFFFPKRGFNF